MSGVLGAMVGSGGGSVSNTFSITAAVMGGGAGYSDGTGGTSTGIVTGSATGATLTGGKIICEVSSFNGTNQDRLRVRGFSADPTQSWLSSITVNGVTHTPATGLTYNYDATHNTANWVWNNSVVTPWNVSSPNTYSGCTIKHGF